MRTVLYVVNVDWFFVSHRLPIALEAIKLGYEVHLVAKDTGRFEDLNNLGIKTHSVNFVRGKANLTNELLSIISLLKIIRKVKPTVIHAVTVKPVLYTGLIKKIFFNNLPFIAAISGLGINFSSDKNTFSSSIVKFLYKVALNSSTTKVIFQNESDRKIILDICNKLSGNDFLIKGSGIDLNEYHFSDEPSGKVVVMASRLLIDKGLFQYHDAAKIVKNTLPNTRFILAGTPDKGSLNSIPLETVAEWKNEGIVEPIGFCTDIAKLIRESNLVVFPSFYGEGVPKILIEAAASGRAIVTTDNPGCRDAIVDKSSGLLVPKRDSKALANAILQLLLDDTLRKSMGYKGREVAEKEFDIIQVVNKHVEIYESFPN